LAAPADLRDIDHYKRETNRLEILSESTEDCIGFKVGGKLEAEDYDVLIPKLDEAIAAHGKINMLVLVEHLEGWDGMDTAKADYRLGTQQYRSVVRRGLLGALSSRPFRVRSNEHLGRACFELGPYAPQQAQFPVSPSGFGQSPPFTFGQHLVDPLPVGQS
jgi:hypothetical protein